jgi:hypothetical protein
MFGKEPWLFETYHQGFRRQTLKWPVNPVDVILKFLKKHPKWTIADLGACRPALPAPLALLSRPRSPCSPGPARPALLARAGARRGATAPRAACARGARRSCGMLPTGTGRL